MGSTTYGTMNDLKRGVAKVTCRTFEAMGQIPMFHRTYFLFRINFALRNFFIIILFTIYMNLATSRESKAHFGLPWVRPGTIAVNVAWVER